LDERQILQRLDDALGETVPRAELRIAAELAEEILELKRRRGAVILAHNYMDPALCLSVADHCGDSLELSRRAAEVDAERIVFCGVRFMAETAKLLSPERTVLLPSELGGCSLAASVTADQVRELKRRHPGVPVVCYVNTYAEVKAESDVCCTSGNAAEVVESLGCDTVIFIPDEFLARNVAAATGRRVLVLDGQHPAGRTVEPGSLLGWPGRCEVHERFAVDDVDAARRQFPDVVVLAHPECRPEVVAAADFSGSTAAMIRFVEDTAAPRYLLLTECAMGDNIAAANPDKRLLRMCSVRCPHMNEVTLAGVRDSLLHDRHRIEVPARIAARAAQAIRRMLEIRPRRDAQTAAPGGR
jgi:quinolinate synthase